MEEAFLIPFRSNQEESLAKKERECKPSIPLQPPKIPTLFTFPPTEDSSPTETSSGTLMLPEQRHPDINVYNEEYRKYASPNLNDISHELGSLNHFDTEAVNNLIRRYSAIALNNEGFCNESEPNENGKQLELKNATPGVILSRKNSSEKSDSPLNATGFKMYSDFERKDLNPNENIERSSKDLFLFDSERCACINPGTSHACSSRLVRGDSFGILNPMFEDEDPEVSSSENKDEAIATTKRSVSSKSKSSKPRRQSSTNSSNEGTENDLVAPELSSNKSSYSDFLAAFSPLDGGVTYPFFSPNDLKEELLFPLPISVQNNVLQNPNAKEATFRIGKPKRKAREHFVPPVKSPSPDGKTEPTTTSSPTGMLEASQVLKPTSLTCQTMPRICVSPSSQAEQASINQPIQGDNYDRGEYLQYKNSEDVSSTEADPVESVDESSKSFLPSQVDNIPISKRRYSSCVPRDKKSTKELKAPPQTRRKTSLPSERSFRKHFDISSVFENDLTASMKYIYQPLPREIFDNSYTTRDITSTSKKSFSKLPNYLLSLSDYAKSDPKLKRPFIPKQEGKYDPQTSELYPQQTDVAAKIHSDKVNSRQNSSELENTMLGLTSCQSQFLTQDSECNSRTEGDDTSCIKVDERKNEDLNFDELPRRKSRTDVEQIFPSAEGEKLRGRKKGQNVTKKTDGSRRKRRGPPFGGLNEEEAFLGREQRGAPSHDYVTLTSSVSEQSDLAASATSGVSTSSSSRSSRSSSKSLSSSPDSAHSSLRSKPYLLSISSSSLSSTSSSSSSSSSSSCSSSSCSSSNSSSTDSSDLDDLLL